MDLPLRYRRRTFSSGTNGKNRFRRFTAFLRGEARERNGREHQKLRSEVNVKAFVILVNGVRAHLLAARREAGRGDAELTGAFASVEDDM